MLRTFNDLFDPSTASIAAVRDGGPLVQCLTNTVTTNLVANAVLAVGASPAMVDIPGEAGLFAGAANAVLINVGTPSAEQREAMLEAARAASVVGTPWVLDPVGVGVLPVRTALAAELLTLKPAAIRGNASEIRALAGRGRGGRGVDALEGVDDARDAAIHLAATVGTVVAVSGQVDLITDGTTVIRIDNGTELFTKITGAGCALGGVIAAYIGACQDPLAAVTVACSAYAVAGELAAETTQLPGSFGVALLDALHTIDDATVEARVRLS